MISLPFVASLIFPRLFGGESESKKTKSDEDAHLPKNVNEIFNEGTTRSRELKHVVLAPNIPISITQTDRIIRILMQIVNPHLNVTMAWNSSLIGTTVIKRNQIGVIQHASSGQIEIVPPGRWFALNPYQRWRGIFDLDSRMIRVDYLTILNVRIGFYGQVFENNFPFFLAPGRHVRLSGVFRYEKCVAQSMKYINHSILHILQVPPGDFARVEDHLRPLLLPSGRHVFVSSQFQFFGMGGGKIIKNKSVTRFRVDRGEVALCFEDQKPVFFSEPGFYIKDDPNFFFIKFVNALEKIVQLGSKKVITVNTGEVGITYLDGRLTILNPGRHILTSSTHKFSSFMSTQQRCLDLSIRADEIENDDSHDRYFEVETRDLVKVGIRAILIFKIDDPERALLEIGDQNQIDTLLIDTALSCLNGIVRSTELTKVSLESQSGPKRNIDFLRRVVKTAINSQKSVFDQNVIAEAEETEGEQKEKMMKPRKSRRRRVDDVSQFFQKAHDEFLYVLHDRFLNDYGIDIVDLRIESFKIIDDELASQISKQAIVTATTQTELANLHGRNIITASDYLRKEHVQRIENEMNSKTEISVAKAEIESMLASAEAQATRDRAIAKGNAEAMAIMAEAKAEAKKIQTKADLEYVKAMGGSELGKKISLLRMKTQMIEKSLEGTEKVLYLDSGNPMGFFDKSTNEIDDIGK